MSKEINTLKYASDKPKDCRFCYWWEPKTNGCKLGEENCYYIIPEEKPKKKSLCEGCPYGKNHPCIGFCMRNLLQK